jgi:hypothetical protein
MQASYDHLNTIQTLETGESIPFYSKVEPGALEATKTKIQSILQEAEDNNFIINLKRKQ